jgi:hypothetical protein
VQRLERGVLSHELAQALELWSSAVLVGLLVTPVLAVLPLRVGEGYLVDRLGVLRLLPLQVLALLPRCLQGRHLLGDLLHLFLCVLEALEVLSRPVHVGLLFE